MPATEVDELKAMFASPPRPNSPPRESALPLTRIAKFAVADENSRLATQGRIEREERLRQREELQAHVTPRQVVAVAAEPELVQPLDEAAEEEDVALVANLQ